MDDVLYSASPMQTFLGSFGMIAFLFVLGAAGLGFALLRRQESKAARLATGVAGAFLVLIAVATTLITVARIATGSETVAIHVNDKLVAQDNCGDGGTCERFVLETQSATNFFDVQVNRATYEQVQVGGCYQLTYYPGRSVLGGSEYGSTYQYIANITNLAVAEASACQ
jgi:hypothetical protein